MPHFELLSCHIKFQLCVGYFPDGRMRTRTFGIRDVWPDVSADDIAAVAGAIAPLLVFPIVAVRLVRKYVLVRDADAPININNAIVGAQILRPFPKTHTMGNTKGQESSKAKIPIWGTDETENSPYNDLLLQLHIL